MRAFKALMAGAVVGALSAVMTVSAFAATAEYADGKVAVSGLDTSATGQMTVLVVPAECWENDVIVDGSITNDNIYYIDQQANTDAADAWASLGIKGGELEEGDYYVLVGGDNVDSITAIKFTVGEDAQIKFCDVNGDGTVDINDVTRLLRHTSNVEALTYTADELLRICNCNGDAGVDINDVTRLLRHTSNVEKIEGVE